MYWLAENAEGIFALRALLLCDRWDTTLGRLRKEMACDRRTNWRWEAPDLANLKPNQTIDVPAQNTPQKQVNNKKAA